MNMPRTILIPNGDNIVHTFSDQEYLNRQQKLKNHMAQSNIDTVIFTSIHSINYYSDFLYCSFGRPYALVVTQDKVTSVTANIDGGQPFRRTFGENLVYTDWQKDSYFYALQQLAKNGGKIGIEYDHITKERLDKLHAALDQADFVDISVDCMKMRSIKSDEEISHIIQGANVCDIGGAALVEAVKEGVPEHEVALHSTQAMVREIAKRYPHSELMDTWTWFQSGINTDGAHNPVTSRQVQKGDILSLNCFSMIAGYYVALERTLFYDHVDEASLKLWEINVKVHEEGMKLIKPGVACKDIALELNKIFEEYGLLESRTFGYGHSFGVLSHYYGREAGVELREDIDTVLQKNMVVSMEPMIMIPEGKAGAGGYREHDVMVLTDDSAYDITKFPFGPEHNIIT
ncbi:MAG: M24 family metallopeptidase [Thiotrichales bacterium]|jgi:creatinase|nr:M24 family metallopeptidase [Thiotrichales bacterium]MBT3855221.1 M24 family metallopeptidase [Thiotrichales bacterium]MBT4653661.1 M24 family metallopeptidase [Thiotrichales bacterium]MBT5499996.1 M24 family metallopeptidase [Thiotrichales bacterium]MBT5984015.1 M24 family metallopeptidase [Thiotrichales bacterium]